MFSQMFMSDKYRRPWSDNARRLTRAYENCQSITHLYADEVAYKHVDNITISDGLRHVDIHSSQSH